WRSARRSRRSPTQPREAAGHPPWLTLPAPGGEERKESLAELRQLAGDLLLAVDHLGDEADAVDVAFVVPGGLDQDAGLVFGRDGQPVQRGGEPFAVELADLLGGELDRMDAGVALDAVVIRQVAEAFLELLLELLHGRHRYVGGESDMPAHAI